MASADRRARKLRLRNRVLQHTSGNASSSDFSTTSDCFLPGHTDYPNAEQESSAARNVPQSGHAGYTQPEWTGYPKLDSFDDNEWQSMLEQLPGIYWVGDDPWYVADKHDKATGKNWKEWERVPLIRPQEQTRYRAYKERKRKDKDKTKSYVVWPAHVERAFEIACICIPPILGKQKLSLRQPDGTMKLCGRNELITWKILHLTGEERQRKQISSHIQVVKKFLKADQNPLLRSVETDPAQVKAVDSKSIRFDDVQGRLVVADPVQTSLPVESKPKVKAFFPNSANSFSVTPTPLPCPSHTPAMVVNQVNFGMQLHTSSDQFLHACTTMQSEVGAQQRPMDDTLTKMFPDLKDCLAGVSGDKCDVLLFESSINFIEDRPPGNSKLVIFYSVDFETHNLPRHYRFRTTRYENKGERRGQRISPEKHRPDFDVQKSSSSQCPYQCRLPEAPLMSDWWVKILSRAVDRRKRVTELGRLEFEKLDHGACDCESCRSLQNDIQKAIAAEEEVIRSDIDDVSVMQELFFDGSNSRAAIFLWRFRVAHTGETATTTWRRLTRGQMSHSASPLPHLLPQPSAILSSSVVADDLQANAEMDSVAEHRDAARSWGMNWQAEDQACGDATHNFLQEQTGLNAQYQCPSVCDPAVNSWQPSPYNLHVYGGAGFLGNEGFDTVSASAGYSSAMEERPITSHPVTNMHEYDFCDAITHYGGTSPQLHAGFAPTVDRSCTFDDFSFDNVADLSLVASFYDGHRATEASTQDTCAGTLSLDEHDSFHYRPSSTLHAPQPRRLISPFHLASPFSPDADHGSRQCSTLNGAGTNSEDLATPISIHGQDLCANGATLAQMTSGTYDVSNLNTLQHHYLSQGEHRRYAYSQIAPPILPSNEEEASSADRCQAIEPTVHTTNYELEHSLLTSSHPLLHVDEYSRHNSHRIDASPIQQDAQVDENPQAQYSLDHHVHNVGQVQAASEPENIHLPVTTIEDNSWVCDFAIAELESWVQHASAMEARLTGTSGEATLAANSQPSTAAAAAAAIGISDTTGLQAGNDHSEHGEHADGTEDEASLARQDVGDAYNDDETEDEEPPRSKEKVGGEIKSQSGEGNPADTNTHGLGLNDEGFVLVDRQEVGGGDGDGDGDSR